MASLFEFTYGDNKIFVMMLVLAWGFLMYYATIPDTGVIMFRELGDYPFLKEMSHFVAFMIGFMLLGPLIINRIPYPKSKSSFGRRR